MDLDISTIPFLALYAETHFKFFRLFPSYLFRKQPEIVFDMPRRINPGNNVPVMLICNDIDRYQIEINNVTIVISQNGSSKIALNTNEVQANILAHPFSKQSNVYLFILPQTLFSPGKFSINGTVTIRSPKKQVTILNDNLKTSSKQPLTAIMAHDRLPGQDYCLYGDLHAHSHYSRSHVEFGPPIDIIDTVASTMGLSFIGITDHSYDLACRMDNYCVADRTAPLWQTLSKEINEHTNTYKSIIIQGEEISTTNSKKNIVHLGALGIREFIPGTRDGARKKLKGAPPEPGIHEAIALIRKQHGISFAAHPGARSGLMQRIFLHRGTWHSADISPSLNAFQAVNNGFTSSWYRAKKLWITWLLSGQKLPLIAGNDAHGDFNRYRYIGIPFLTVNENFNRYLGFARTGIYGQCNTRAAVLASIRQGKTFVTTGPYCGISSSENPGDSVISHAEYSSAHNAIYVHGITTEEFGVPTLLRIFRGNYSTKKEKLLACKSYTKKSSLTIREQVPVDIENGPGYVRASLTCTKEDGSQTMAVTSPVYLR